MELIPKSKIEQAAKVSAIKTVLDLPIPELRTETTSDEWGGWFTDEFKSGAQFAISELEPLFCEFAEWIAEDYISYYSDSEKRRVWFNPYEAEYKTTEQLFKLFKEKRNNEKNQNYSSDNSI